MGPGESIEAQRLVDLPTTIETADHHPPHSHSIHRVRSMLHSTTGKFMPSRLPPSQGGGHEPPRRFYSHQQLPHQQQQQPQQQQPQPHYSNVHNGGGPPLPSLPPPGLRRVLPPHPGSGQAAVSHPHMMQMPPRSPEEPRHQIIHQLQEVRELLL